MEKIIDFILRHFVKFFQIAALFFIFLSMFYVGYAMVIQMIQPSFDITSADLFPENRIVTIICVSFVAILLKDMFPSGIIIDSENQSNNLNARIAALTKALSDASNSITAIQNEIDSRQSLVEKLETQKAIAEQAITLSKTQVDAVAAILSQQVSQQSQKDSRKELVKDLLIFMAGIVATLLLHQLGF